MTLTIELNIKPEKALAAQQAVESLYAHAKGRLQRDKDGGRMPTQVENDHVESLSIASAVLGAVRRAMP